MYSGGNRKDFPITTGYDTVDYEEFISSYLLNSQNILICQGFYNGRFSGCFAPSKRYSPRPRVPWVIEADKGDFIKSVEEHWDAVNGKSKQIYSLACDRDLGFAAFFMAKYGTAQVIVSTSRQIEMKWDDDFHITSCAARGSELFIVMTKGTKEYEDKDQTWFTGFTWNETYNEINEQHRAGYTVTGICYSTGLGQYFVVFTKIPELQSSHYFDGTASVLNWMDEQHHVGYHPTIIFRVPTLKKTLVVMTTDKNRSSYEYAFGYELE